jgi:hypothetical protein
MAFSFGVSEQFGDVVVTETLAEPERACFGAIGFGSGRLEDFIQTRAQGGINYAFERLAEPGRTALCFGGDIRIERQGGSHKSIMMLSNGKVNLFFHHGGGVEHAIC